MIKYFYLQIKRLLKILPSLLIAWIVLAMALGVFLGGMIENDKNDVKNQKFKISVVGSAEDNYLSMGITALETLDSTRFAVEIEQTDEKTARKNLESGKTAAYVVIPEGFSEAAYRGEIMKIKYYTTDSAVGVVSIFKDEVTKTISDILVDSQKGVYGLSGAVSENTSIKDTGKSMTKLALEYVSLILKRSEIYTVSALGVSDGLSTAGYFLCGILTLLILLLGIVATGVFIKRDNSLCRVIRAKGIGAVRQVICEYSAYFLLIFFITSLIIAVLGFARISEIIPDTGWLTPAQIPLLLIKIIPAVAVITSLQFLLFEISSNLVSGVLLQFLTAVSLGYVSGCFYPIYFFPEAVQKLSDFLPSGLARVYLSGCLSNNSEHMPLLLCAIYFIIPLLAAVIVRRFKIVGRK